MGQSSQTQRWLITSIYNQTPFILTIAIGGRYDDHVHFTKQKQTKGDNLPRFIKLVNDHTGTTLEDKHSGS